MPRLLTARKAAGFLECIAKAVFERNCCSKLIQDTELSTEDNNNIYIYLLHIMCGYQCDKAVNKSDTCEVI